MRKTFCSRKFCHQVFTQLLNQSISPGNSQLRTAKRSGLVRERTGRLIDRSLLHAIFDVIDIGAAPFIPEKIEANFDCGRDHVFPGVGSNPAQRRCPSQSALREPKSSDRASGFQGKLVECLSLSWFMRLPFLTQSSSSVMLLKKLLKHKEVFAIGIAHGAHHQRRDDFGKAGGRATVA